VAENFAAHRKAIWRFLRSALSSDVLTDDLAQEVWRRLLMVKAPGSITRPLSYIFTVAGRVLADHYRTLQVKTVPVGAESERTLDEHSAQAGDCTFNAICSAQLLDVILERLPAHHAEILILRVCQGLSFRQIGEQMGFTPQTTERYFFAAAEKARAIRDELQDADARSPASRAAASGPSASGPPANGAQS
jgi:RNA polymerase sigma-70 factor (ECF subfamily)